MTRHEFNSCALNLYRTGHDNIGWHSDSMPALGANPAIASVSLGEFDCLFCIIIYFYLLIFLVLGALRTFELRRRGRVHNFIRFPLFPGSLLLMEGATQEDWSHQVCFHETFILTPYKFNFTQFFDTNVVDSKGAPCEGGACEFNISSYACD